MWQDISLKWWFCGGGNNSKQRIRVLLACSANGNHKLSLLLFGKTENHCCLNNVRIFPTIYVSSRKVHRPSLQNIQGQWMPDWFPKSKILLLWTSVLLSPKTQSYIKNVKVVNFPLNCSSIFQSSDRGIIRPFRHYNSQQCVRKTFCDSTHFPSWWNIHDKYFGCTVGLWHCVLHQWWTVVINVDIF
jgi:hypothetical protein